MYLGNKEIVRRIKEENLLENYDLENVQGAGVDLSIERLFELNSEASLGKEERRLPELGEVTDDAFYLQPDKYYLCTTKEKVNMPEDLVAFIFPRSTLFRSGVSLRTAVVDPGYKGRLTIGIKNETSRRFVLEKDARIAQIVFSRIHGKATGYEGKYQGGKVK